MYQLDNYLKFTLFQFCQPITFYYRPCVTKEGSFVMYQFTHMQNRLPFLSVQMCSGVKMAEQNNRAVK